MKTDENGENGKEYTEGEALNEIFERVDPNTPHYNTLRSYKSRYRNGKLGRGAIAWLLEFFGFRPTSYQYYRKKDRSRGEENGDAVT